MIDEVEDRYPFGEHRRAAEVIGVEMGVDQIVDLLDPGLFQDREHPRDHVRQAGVRRAVGLAV